MSDPHHDQDFILQVGQCSAALRKLGRACGDKGQLPATILAENFEHLSAAAAARDLVSIRQIVDSVGKSLSTRAKLPARLGQLERDTLNLAAEWLDELIRFFVNKLPEPRGLISNLVYSFSLLERAKIAGDAKRAEASDHFAADPAVFSDVWLSYPRGGDPFAEDPGFGHLFDLFQRTLNHVACLGVTCGPDPFGRDPDVCKSGTVDLFEKDPPLPIADADVDPQR